jgi:cell division protease FtsH
MSDQLGPMTFGDGGGPGFLGKNNLPWAGGKERDYSEETARAIDAAVRKIVEAAYERVRSLLSAKKSILLAAAAVLKEKETLDGPELRRLLAGEPVPAASPA